MMRRLLLPLSLLLMTLSVAMGAAEIPFSSVWRIIINRTLQREIFTPEWSRGLEMIIWNIRLPRVILAFTAGGTLSLIGVFMQAITKNPLADPYILGISSGASAGAVLCMFFGLGYLSVGGGAFLGALAAILMVMLLTRGNFSSVRLVLTGIAVSALFSSATNIMIYLVKDEGKVKSALFWMSGSLGGGRWEILPLPFIVLVTGFLIGIFFHKELDLLLLGEDGARTLGVDTGRLKLFFIAVSSLLTGVMVSVTGTIGFIGIVIPHISRILVGGKHRKLVPFSLLLGGTFIVGADIVARTIFSPEELPIGILTSALGGPFFLWLVKKKTSLQGARS